MRRLADLPVAAKVGLVLLVPLLALVTLAGLAARGYAQAGDLRTAAALGSAADRAAGALGRERYAALVLLDGLGGDARAGFAARAAATDDAIRSLRGFPDAAGLAAELDALPALRAQA